MSSLFPGSLSSLSSAVSHHHPAERTPTPAFSPPPPDRKVRWGTPEVFSAVGGSASEEEEQQEEEEDKVVLAITALKGKMGCCYLDPSGTGVLHFLPDTGDEGWDLTALVINQLNSQYRLSKILTSSSADSAFLHSLETSLRCLPSSFSNNSSSSSVKEEEEAEVELQYRPPREFYAGQRRAQLGRVVAGFVGSSSEEDDGGGMVERGGGEGGDQARRNAELRLEAFLPSGLEGCSLTLGCAGALLGHFARTGSALQGSEEGEDEGEQEGSYGIRGIELMRMDKVMLINQDALSSLQIFSPESHASPHSSSTKEGLSLFGILNHTRTPLGHALLRSWFLRPPTEMLVIDARHDAVECFLRSENHHVADAIQTHFKGVRNVRRKLNALRDGKAEGVGEWQTIWQFLYASIMIRDCCLSLVHRKGVEIVEKFLLAFDAEHFRELGSMINDVIDWEESALAKRVTVKSGVDSELDELRRTYHGLSSLLSRVATDLSLTISPDFAESLSVIYFPQLGYLINIPYKEGVADPERLEAIGWEFQFVTEEYAYFKSDKCRDLDRHLGDLHSFISDKEIEILHALLSHILLAEPSILATCTCLAELDCLLAFAEASRLYKWNRPTMTERPVCKIQGGRHPLVELCVDAFVPNDIALVGGRGVGWQDGEEGEEKSEPPTEPGVLDPNQSMIIVTGANYSGKSIFLKQVALLTFMAHLGCFIPAERSLIGITDRILTRVSTRESITKGSSAFMIDLQQISFALRNATFRSLLIIDEFGKGTESDDGAALFCAVMEHLIRRGEHAPRVAAATHFHNVFANSLLSKELPIGFASMAIQINESTDASGSGSSVVSSADTNLTYLYRLSPTVAHTSHAAACASLFGISPSILSRANEVSQALLRFDLDSILNAALKPEEQAELREGERVGRRLLQWDMDDEEWGHEEVGSEEVKRKLGWVLGMLDEDEEMQEDEVADA